MRDRNPGQEPLLALPETLVCFGGRGHGTGLVYGDKCIEITVFTDPVQTMTRQLGAADLPSVQHVAKRGEAMLVKHGKALQLRIMLVTATPETGLFDNPGNEVQSFINTRGTFLHGAALVGFRDLVFT